MAIGTESIYNRACNEILKIVPEFKDRIEKGTVSHNSLVAIARSVIIEKNYDGSFSVSESKLKNKIPSVKKEHLDLISEIFSKRAENVEKEVKKRKSDDVLEEDEDISTKKQKPQGSVGIIRSGTKRKANSESEVEEDFSKPAKKQKAASEEPKIENIEDFFDITKGLPTGLMGLTAGYLPETSYAIFSLARNKNKIPGYLIENTSELDLVHQNIDIYTFSDLIEQFGNLKSLTLPRNADDRWLKILAKKLPNLTSLNLSWCFNISDISSLAALRSLTYLNLSGCSKISDISSLKTLTALTSLDLSFCSKISDISSIAYLTSLTYLNLTECEISDISSLVHLTALATLILTYCSKLRDIHSLAALPSLTTLDLSCSNISYINSLTGRKNLKIINFIK